jgi:hypothetical protein
MQRLGMAFNLNTAPRTTEVFEPIINREEQPELPPS